MKTNESNISYHISGYHSPRELALDERDEPRMVVHFPRGFETFDIAVYGHGLSECDCVEAACDFLRKGNANALAENDEEYAFVTL